MSAQHTPGLDIAAQSAAFTYTVERFMRSGDGSDPRVPPTEGEVIDALYSLRANASVATVIEAELLAALRMIESNCDGSASGQQIARIAHAAIAKATGSAT